MRQHPSVLTLQQVDTQFFEGRFSSQTGIEMRGLPLGWIRIIPVAVFVLDFPVLAVDVEFGALVLAYLAPGINRILLLVEVAAATSRAVFFDIPTAVSAGYDMM